MNFPRLFFVVVLSGLMTHMTPMTHAENNPVANPDAVVIDGHARFTVLSEVLVRLEYSPDAKFEDRASYFVVNRNLPVVDFHVERVNTAVHIRSRGFHIKYDENGEPFNKDNLKVLINVGDRWVEWGIGTPVPDNLGGTTRTLDGVSGSSDLEPGWLTRSGYPIIDDSRRILFDNSDWPWAVSRDDNGDQRDWYLCTYGEDYAMALREITSIAGRIPVPPRFAFGAWWSRYWAYSDAELRKLVGEFQEHEVPLDVLVVDMDWHLPGWTGYTWNPMYFSNPEDFLCWCQENGLKVPLNLHPAEGVAIHEEQFATFANACGADPAKVDHVPFDCTDKRYMRAYFDILHRPLEALGVSFWWIDWQQGEETLIAGLDPLPWLNYLHWTDMERNPARDDLRPLLFSRWGGYGNHRYQIGFSGDTFCNWPSLAFQPFFTATAGNVGYAYWSHDIGGHQPGPVDPELYTRWIQWGVLSPILRTHTTKNPDAERRIWEFDEPYYSAMKAAWKLRYELVPYLYMTARQAYEMSLPLCRPLYINWPGAPEAYEYRNEYLLGDQLLVMPVTQPMDESTKCAFVDMWIPPGEWVNWFTGRRYTGPREISLPVALDEIPLFVRSGGIIPIGENLAKAAGGANAPLALRVFPGEHNRIRFYEDDGTSRGYERNEVCWTTIESSGNERGLRFLVDRAEGGFEGMPTSRAIVARFQDSLPPSAVTINGQPIMPAKDADGTGWFYDARNFELVVRTDMQPVSRQTAIRISFPDLPNSREYLRRGLRGELGSLGNTIDKLKNTRIDSQISGILKQISHFGTILKDNPPSGELLCATLRDDSAAIFSAINDPDVEGMLAGATTKALGITARFLQDSETGALRFVTQLDPALFDLRDARIQQTVTVGTEENRCNATLEDTPADFICAVPTAAGRPEIPQSHHVVGLFELTPAGQITTRLSFSQDLHPSINGWWIAGPFDETLRDSLDEEMDALREFDSTRVWKDGKDGRTAKWHRVVRAIDDPSLLPTDEFLVNFRDVFGWRPSDACAYAFCDIVADRAMDAQLAIGSDDGVTIWLNGEKVFTHHDGRAFTSRENITPISLRQGENRLMVRIDQHGGDWAFAIHVEGRNGDSITQQDISDRLRVTLPE